MSDPDTLLSLTNMMTTNIGNDLSVMSELIPFTIASKISQRFPFTKGAKTPGFWKHFWL